MRGALAKLKGLMTYAAVGLLVPGGSLIMLMWWLYRRYAADARR
jgi:hypothetical protein